MYKSNALAQPMTKTPFAPLFASEVRAELLSEEAKSETLEFLAARPLHTVMLAGAIRDNGLNSPLNRGDFYGCRNDKGELEGVALIGHATLIEASTDRALRAFAELAGKCSSTHMIMGEAQRLEEFWSYYSPDGGKMNRFCREHLLELQFPMELTAAVPGLRLANLYDLDLLLPVHAQMAFEQSGVNPLDHDEKGFRLRYERRIQQGRTWVWIDNGKLCFKADLVSKTPHVSYLEGVWVEPTKRSGGWGTRCLSQVARNLLSSTSSVCVFVNENNSSALKFYKRVGFRAKAVYDTVFMRRSAAEVEYQQIA